MYRSSIKPNVARNRLPTESYKATRAKIDTLQSYSYLLNQKFLPEFLEGDKKKFIDYIRT